MVDSMEAKYAQGLLDAIAWAPTAPPDELAEFAKRHRAGKAVWVRRDHSLVRFWGVRLPADASPFTTVRIVDTRCRGYGDGFLAGLLEVRPNLFDTVTEGNH